jgi:hypothetical protein
MTSTFPISVSIALTPHGPVYSNLAVPFTHLTQKESFISMENDTHTFPDDLDAFFARQDDLLGSVGALDEGSSAGWSAALAAANGGHADYNESCMLNPVSLSLSNNSTAVSSPLTPGSPIPRPKLGSRFSRDVIRILKDWLAGHQQHPYPNETEMNNLQNRTGMNKAQLTNWFANARRRGKVQSVRPSSPQVQNMPTTPVDIIPRPGTPAVGRSVHHMDPMQRWVESPPEHEFAAVGDIARAMASTSRKSP